MSAARTSPVLKAVVEAYAVKVGIALKPQYEGENLSSAMSLVAGVGE